MSNQIYVRGLRDVHQKDVRNEFSRYGKINDLQIHKDYGFIVSCYLLFELGYRRSRTTRLARMPSMALMAAESSLTSASRLNLLARVAPRETEEEEEEIAAAREEAAEGHLPEISALGVAAPVIGKISNSNYKTMGEGGNVDMGEWKDIK
jgi:hypothetical protein